MYPMLHLVKLALYGNMDLCVHCLNFDEVSASKFLFVRVRFPDPAVAIMFENY